LFQLAVPEYQTTFCDQKSNKSDRKLSKKFFQKWIISNIATWNMLKIQVYRLVTCCDQVVLRHNTLGLSFSKACSFKYLIEFKFSTLIISPCITITFKYDLNFIMQRVFSYPPLPLSHPGVGTRQCWGYRTFKIDNTSIISQHFYSTVD